MVSAYRDKSEQPAQAHDERVARYVRAIATYDWEVDPASAIATRVMVVADAEQATLQKWFEAANAAAERRMDQSIKWMERAEAAERALAGERAKVAELNNEVQRLHAEALSGHQLVEGALDRVSAALAGHPECDVHPDDDPVSCGWKRAVIDARAALADPEASDG